MVGFSVCKKSMVAAVKALLFWRDGGGGKVARRERILPTEFDGFVHGKPVSDFVAIARIYYLGVGDEIFDDVGRKPAAVRVLEEERGIPLRAEIRI